MLHPCLVHIFISVGQLWYHFLNLLCIDCYIDFGSFGIRNGSQNRPFGPPVSIEKWQQDDLSLPGGVRESVWEATLRRTTLQNWFLRTLDNCWTIWDRFFFHGLLTMFFNIGTCLWFLHRFHKLGTKQPSHPRPGGMRVSVYAAPLVEEHGVLDHRNKFLQCFAKC